MMQTTIEHEAPFAEVDMAPAEVEVEHRDGGVFVLRSPQRLESYEPILGRYLERWAREAPDRAFLAEKAEERRWRRIGYAETLASVRAIGQALLDRALSAERPVMILSGNSIDHALVGLGAMHVGVPYAPVSVAYSTLSRDHAKLKAVFEALRPGLVFAEEGEPFAAALDALDLGGIEIVCSMRPPPGRAVTALADLLATRPTGAVDLGLARLGPETVGKILFTSGSTGAPKGVINTHRMMTSNQQSYRQILRFLSQTPPVFVDWTPWNHTAGGNADFNLVLTNGGTFYIDDGKPSPELIGRTLETLRDVSPTIYFNVPVGYAALVDALEADRGLAETFFRDLQFLFYAGASLPQDLWQRLQALAVAVRGERVIIGSGYGSTETAPMATLVHFPVERAGLVGLPGPGTAIKFVPCAEKLEMRVKGPGVTPGYWKRPDLTQAAFDEEGFYRMGDAGRLVDPDDPSKGIAFDGRTSEDFKLATGTWVHVGALRLAMLGTCAPVIQDCVVAGEDRDEVGLLLFPKLAGCQEVATSVAPDTPVEELVAAPEVRACLEQALRAHNQAAGGSSRRVGRVLVMTEPPSIDAGEITDKGYVNQRAVLTRRTALVERLYSDHPDVIRLT